MSDNSETFLVELHKLFVKHKATTQCHNEANTLYIELLVDGESFAFENSICCLDIQKTLIGMRRLQELKKDMDLTMHPK